MGDIPGGPVRWLTAFVDRPAPAVDAAVAFWGRVTASRLSPRRGEFATFLPPDGDAYLRVQTVADGPGGAHLDVHVADPFAEAERAVALGATASSTGDYVTLTSPAGLAWCLVPAGGDGTDAGPVRPRPVARPGVTSLVDQLCLDVPPDAFGDECRFWAELTGWPVTHRAGEFAPLHRPATMPLRLLMQCLDETPADGRASCHLDLATTDEEAEVAVHVGWGAEVVRRGRGWTTLLDPGGVAYCVTRRLP